MLTLTPRIVVVCCADAPMTYLTRDLVDGVRRVCGECGITHLKTASGLLSPVERWASVAAAKIAEQERLDEKVKPNEGENL